MKNFVTGLAALICVVIATIAIGDWTGFKAEVAGLFASPGPSPSDSPKTQQAAPPTGEVASAKLPSQTQGDALEAFESGKQHGRAGNLSSAITEYSRAISIAPTFVDAYTYRGLSHSRLGNLAEAIRDLDKAIELDPSPDSYRTRADVNAQAGQRQAAIRDYTIVLQHSPRDASALVNRATAHLEQDDLASALSDATRAIEINDKSANANAYYIRAIVKAKNADYQSAMNDADIALQVLGVTSMAPGEVQLSNELTGHVLRLVADLEKVGARRKRTP